MHGPIFQPTSAKGFFHIMQTELPDHALEEYVLRAFNSSHRRGAIDRLDIAQQLLPYGAHPAYWQAAKKLADHVLDHMAMQGKLHKDDQGWWYFDGGLK